jgi:hypothetical protein
MSLGEAFIGSKLLVAVLLALAAVLALVLGYRIFKGKAGHERDGTLIKAKSFEIRVGTVGATIMLTSVALGWLSARTLPSELSVKPNETKISGIDAAVGETILVSSGAGESTRFRECKREQKDFVCFNVRPGAQCGQPPAFVNGLARLQAVSIPRTGPGSDVTAANYDRQLRQVLSERAIKDWGLHVMNYVGKENGQPVRRVVFNGVSRDLEKPMCMWLRCEGWTVGPCQTLPNMRDDVAPDEP